MGSVPQKKPAYVLRLLVFFAALVIVGYSIWWLAAYQRGMLAARWDHARGHFEIQVYGYPPEWRDDYARLLHERFGVEVNTVAACVVTDELGRYVDGYNAVSQSGSVARFGKDIFAECEVDARKALKLNQ